VSRIKELEIYAEKVKSVYLASVAHELRTPLNSIIPMAASLKKKITDPQPRKHAEVIHSSAVYLQNVIEDALDMTRLEHNQFEVQEEEFNPRDSLSLVQECL